MPMQQRYGAGPDQIDRMITDDLRANFMVEGLFAPGEIRFARWDEFDFERAEWRIPAERMKMRTEHLVPLSRQALAVLNELKLLTGHVELLFPSQTSNSIFP